MDMFYLSNDEVRALGGPNMGFVDFTITDDFTVDLDSGVREPYRLFLRVGMTDGVPDAVSIQQQYGDEPSALILMSLDDLDRIAALWLKRRRKEIAQAAREMDKAGEP